MDTQITNILIIIHAIAGGVALCTGSGALIVMKGGRAHRMFGKIFFYFMMLTALLALVVSNLPNHKNLFLFSMGIFSIYLVGTGYRYISLDDLHKGQKPMFIDWVLTTIMALFGVWLFVVGIMLLTGYSNLNSDKSFGIVMMVFGGFGLMMVMQDINGFRGKVQYRNHWLLMHISRMIGANIAAFTAFLVVNNKILPNVVAWLLPTAIGIPLMMYWQNKHKKIQGMKIEVKE